MCPVGDVDPSFVAPLAVAVFPLQVLVPLGVGLFDRFGRLVLDELAIDVPMDVGARLPCLVLIAESSLLTDGRSALASSLLL